MTSPAPVRAPALDLDALDRLARAAADTASARWYYAHELSSDTDYREEAEFIAYCTPERVAQLVAAARRGAEDSARLDWFGKYSVSVQGCNPATGAEWVWGVNGANLRQHIDDEATAEGADAAARAGRPTEATDA